MALFMRRNIACIWYKQLALNEEKVHRAAFRRFSGGLKSFPVGGLYRSTFVRICLSTKAMIMKRFQGDLISSTRVLKVLYGGIYRNLKDMNQNEDEK